jgi:hypothetical protein
MSKQVSGSTIGPNSRADAILAMNISFNANKMTRDRLLGGEDLTFEDYLLFIQFSFI